MFKLQIIAAVIAATVSLTEAASLDVTVGFKQCNDDGTWNWDNGDPGMEIDENGNLAQSCACIGGDYIYCCECPASWYD